MILSFNKSFDIISILGHNHPVAVNKAFILFLIRPLKALS